MTSKEKKEPLQYKLHYGMLHIQFKKQNPHIKKNNPIILLFACQRERYFLHIIRYNKEKKCSFITTNFERVCL